MKIIGTVIVMLLAMPVMHVILFGSGDTGEATFYYWLFGVPALLFIVPLVGYPLLALLRACRLQGFAAVLVGTMLCALAGGLAISGAHGVIPEVIAIAAVFGGIGGFTWTLLARDDLRTVARGTGPAARSFASRSRR
jgi:hypothetical protein